MHHEVELALIVGKQVRDLSADDEKGALDAVQGEPSRIFGSNVLSLQPPFLSLVATGYAIAVDMTARNIQDEAKKKGLPWDIAKGFDTFLPVSKVIEKSAIPDPHDAELYLKVNHEVRQQGSTELMLFRIPRILSDISKIMTLEPGDIVLTGTPRGVGPVVPGDIVHAGIKVGGKEVEEGKIEVWVEQSTGSYEYGET
jgi:2-keto-4-pentenoate hydratase/2-oxohepta-3-ene-1,7-dioic acid hydratase in catechol pathway